jgi:hypothetical protein
MFIPHTSSAIGTPSLELEQAVVVTLLDMTSAAWARLKANGERLVRIHERQLAADLRSQMVEEKKARGLGIRIQEEVGTRSPTSSVPDGRIDIMIIHNFVEDEYFGIECKRIRGRRMTLAKKYVEEGVMRFVQGKYSPGHQWGALVGFAIDDDCLGAAAQVETQINSKQGDTALLRAWQPEHGSRIPHLYSSVHKQNATTSKIQIFHLFLSVN